MNVASERLEDALRTYEDLCRIHELMATDLPADMVDKMPYAGALVNWRTLRQKLLDGTQCPFASSDWAIPPCNREQPLFLFWKLLESLPLELWSWMHYSRRIYAIDTNLQKFLLGGNYSQLRWSDILFPFRVFVVELATPIGQLEVDYETGVETSVLFDSIFVEWFAPTEKNEGILKLRLFLKKSHDRKGFLRQSERQQHDIDLERRKLVRLAGRSAKLLKRKDPQRNFQQGTHVHVITLPVGEDPSVEIEPEDMLRSATSNEFDANDFLVYSRAAKIAIGLSLYLAHMSDNSEPVEWKLMGVSRPGPLNVITDGAHICSVVGRSVFDPTIFHSPQEGKRRREGFEMPPHHRQAHMRRPRGSSANAPKTIRVSATFVHKDRMPPAAIAGGTRKEVRFED